MSIVNLLDWWIAVERRPVVGYEGLYEISDDGRVFSMTRRLKSHLRSTFSPDGSVIVELSKNGACMKRRVHRIVAMAFVENPNEYDQVVHLDGDKKNNTVQNLAWRDSRMDIVNRSMAFIKRTGKTKKKDLVICATDITSGVKLLFKSIRSAESHGFSPMAISNCCSGRCKSYAGYSWSYVNE